jgi:RNA polymerase sigma-70 factor, ECF subfamily
MGDVERWDAGATGPTVEAFAELVRSNSKLIYRVSFGILKNHADAEDNLQNVFIKAYKNMRQFEGRSRLSSWLVRITINEALMKIRNRRLADTALQIKVAAQDENYETLQIEDARPNPEHQCIANDLAAKALCCLSPSLRDTFLRKAEGWTHQELANVMGISVGTIKTRIFRARARMRHKLTSLAESGGRPALMGQSIMQESSKRRGFLRV